MDYKQLQLKFNLSNEQIKSLEESQNKSIQIILDITNDYFGYPEEKYHVKKAGTIKVRNQNVKMDVKSNPKNICNN